MNRFQKAINSLFGKSEIQNSFYKAIYSFFNGYFYTLPQNKETYVKEGYQKNLDVYSIIKLIAGKAAGAKLKAYTTIRNEKVELIDTTNYLYRLLQRPNESERQQQFIEEALSWLLITGDLYIYKLPYLTGKDKGKVNRLYCLPSQYVQIIGGGWTDPIEGYKMIIGDQEVIFGKDEVIHIKYFNPNFGVSGEQLYGQSPLMAALSTVQSSNEGLNAKIKAFLNGGTHGLLSSADANNPMSVEQIAQLNDLIKSKLTGTDNTKGITATNGLVNYQQIGMSPADLEILKSIQFDAYQLSKIYGVDPILFSVEGSSYNNKAEAYKSLVNNVCVPLLNLFQDALNEAVNDMEYIIEYDISHFAELQDDIQTMVSSLKDAYWITPNEKRKYMNLPLIEDGLLDKFLIPSNLVPLDELDIDLDLNENDR